MRPEHQLDGVFDRSLARAERIAELEERVRTLEAALRLYADRENWDRVYAECRDEFLTAWDVTGSADYRNEAWRIAEEALEPKP